MFQIIKFVYSKGDVDKITEVSRIVEELPLGKILKSSLEKEQSDDPIRSYLSDFVAMKYAVTSDAEQKVCSIKKYRFFSFLQSVKHIVLYSYVDMLSFG